MSLNFSPLFWDYSNFDATTQQKQEVDHGPLIGYVKAEITEADGGVTIQISTNIRCQIVKITTF